MQCWGKNHLYIKWDELVIREINLSTSSNIECLKQNMSLFQASKPCERKSACKWDCIRNLTTIPAMNRSQVIEQRVQYKRWCWTIKHKLNKGQSGKYSVSLYSFIHLVRERYCQSQSVFSVGAQTLLSPAQCMQYNTTPLTRSWYWGFIAAQSKIWFWWSTQCFWSSFFNENNTCFGWDIIHRQLYSEK